MSKEEQKIIVVHKDLLFGNNFFEGFMQHGETDYEFRILYNMKTMRRGNASEEIIPGRENAERNSEYKQPIGYAVLINPETKKVFAYQRATNSKDYTETRLQGKWSWGFGGHIESKDTNNGNPIRESVLREISEEVEVHGRVKIPKVLGYIYHDFDVHAVHFGILYAIETDATKATPRDNEIKIIEPKSMGELEEMCKNSEINVEEWSKTALAPIRKFYKF